MTYIATISTPGYLPDMDPEEFETCKEAWLWLYEERCSQEREAPCDLCQDTLSHGPFGDCDDDSETGDALSARGLCENPEPGTVTGSTPGYWKNGVGHDLGLAYTVTRSEES